MTQAIVGKFEENRQCEPQKRRQEKACASEEQYVRN